MPLSANTLAASASMTIGRLLSYALGRRNHRHAHESTAYSMIATGGRAEAYPDRPYPRIAPPHQSFKHYAALVPGCDAPTRLEDQPSRN